MEPSISTVFFPLLITALCSSQQALQSALHTTGLRSAASLHCSPDTRQLCHIPLLHVLRYRQAPTWHPTARTWYIERGMLLTGSPAKLTPYSQSSLSDISKANLGRTWGGGRGCWDVPMVGSSTSAKQVHQPPLHNCVHLLKLFVSPYLPHPPSTKSSKMYLEFLCSSLHLHCQQHFLPRLQ